jgi:hypothetical protein
MTRIEIVLPPSSDPAPIVLLDVELEYAVRNPWRVLPIVGAMPRYFVTATNAMQRYPVTLDPYTTSAHFPILVARGTNPTLVFETYSLLPGASFAVRAARAATVVVDDGNGGWLVDMARQQSTRTTLPDGARAAGLFQWR